MRQKFFPNYVSYDAVSEAGFNYWEKSLSFSKDNKVYMVYLTRDREDKKNIVIIEKLL